MGRRRNGEEDTWVAQAPEARLAVTYQTRFQYRQRESGVEIVINALLTSLQRPSSNTKEKHLLHCSALLCTTLHCPALHCIAGRAARSRPQHWFFFSGIDPYRFPISIHRNALCSINP